MANKVVQTLTAPMHLFSLLILYALANWFKSRANKVVSSAEIIAGNVDLLSEILLRVPAKSLIKFKSVSRQWLALLSDSSFCHNHTRHNPSPPISGLYFSPHGTRWLNIHGKIIHVPFRDDHQLTTLPNFSFLDGSEARNLRVCHSSNGLMLCTNRAQTYVVCNLTTQKFVVLPKITVVPKSKLDYEIRCGYLIYDPRKSLHYKVVVFRSLYGDNFQFDVYSSESSSWTSTVAIPRVPIWWSIIDGAVWNGAIFWISKHYDAYFLFDIDAKKFTRTPLPSLGSSNAYEEILYFGECGGRLFLIPGPCNGATEFRMLEMMHKETEFRWTVKYIVDSPVIMPPLRTGRSRYLAGCVMNVGANENDLVVVLFQHWKVVQYNIVSKSLKVLFEFPSLGDYPSFPSNVYMHSYQFIQSLAPI